ncbi:hypothetical protein CP975_00745 [Streptomyces alboniger]|uniref:Uncharacterized protein n=1 Tax=Streptomyces alboniger TaxID=132473 RepID=A0A5J6HCD7_STRAD|nr:hypothetical protein CP975_00745 [Streptomyces alboniger]
MFAHIAPSLAHTVQVDNLPLSAFDSLLGLRNRGILSEEQAIQEIRSLPPLSAADAEAAAERIKAPPPSAAEAVAHAQDVGTGRPSMFGSLEHRRTHFLLLHESVRPRDDGSLGPHRAVRDCLIATVDLLTDQQDAVVLDKAARLADAYVAETASAQAHNLAGRVHFEPYSLGAGSMSYPHDVSLRDYRRAWAMGVPRPWSEPKRTDTPSSEWKRFPGIEESFQRATAYFQRAADLDDGVERGRALAYLALIDLTKATAGAPLDHPRLEGRLDEADRLLPTGVDPSIWARLWLFVGDLRDPSVMLRRPRVHVRNFANMLAEYGLHATTWLYLSALELATGAGDFGQLTALAQILHPYLPHVGMEQARLHFTSQWWHFLPEDPTGCEQHLTGTPPETFLAYGQPAAAVHALLHARVAS